MRLREIKPGMAIHCSNDEEKQALLEEAERLGYRWYGGEIPTCKNIHVGSTIHFYDVDFYKDYKCILWSNETEGATEFSDFILPELTAEEVLNAIKEICKESSGCSNCPLSGGTCLVRTARFNTGEVIKICQQWKSDHEKKEPEIETVDICRIIEVLPDRKMVVHEETMDVPTNKEMEEILKCYCMEHEGEFIAVHEVISRVKKKCSMC